jgi:hypothetical protein
MKPSLALRVYSIKVVLKKRKRNQKLVGELQRTYWQ